ncbi:hypothetical protein EJB05_53423, partial [Eragrostis curvula]
MASPAGSDDDGNKKEAPPARAAAWDPLPAVDPEYCAVMGGAEDWPALPGSAAAAAKAPSSSAATAAPQSITKPQTPSGNLGASSSRHGDRATPVPERRRAAAVPETSSSIMPHASNNNVNGSGFRGRQNDGRSAPPHPRGRGYNNGGSRRPANGGPNGRGDINVHVHINGNNNVNGGGGGWHGQESRRGGFNEQRRGRGNGHQHDGHWHGPGHRPAGPQMEPPQQPMLPPPFVPMVAPPYYDPYYGYGPYAYAPEFFYFPPPQEGHGFVPYPMLPMHMMPPQWEQQGPYMGPQQQQAPQEQPKATTTEEEQRQHAPPSAEELQRSLRAQIEYYFSSNNLSTDTYLRKQMDEQGWVPLTVIASFPRVKERTTDMDFIMSSVLASDEVEVQDGKIRKRTGWEKYPLPRSNCS